MDFDVNGKSIWLYSPKVVGRFKPLIAKAKAQTRWLKDVVWIASSGTSDPEVLKFIGIDKKALLESAKAVVEHLQIKKSDRIYNPLPLHHVGGIGTWLRCKISRTKWVDGSKKKWNPSQFTQELKKNKITLTSLVPTQVFDLVAQSLRPNKELRAVVVGGARLDQDLYFKGLTLGWPLLPSYGMTEHGSQIATAPLRSLGEPDWPTLHWLKHIQSVQSFQTRSGKARIAIKSLSQCSYVLKIKSSGEIQLELAGNKYGVPIDDQIEWDSKVKTLNPIHRLNSEVKVLGELVNLEALEVNFRSLLPSDLKQKFCIGATDHSREGQRLVLFVEGLKNFSKWTDWLSVFNKKANGLHRISRIEFLNEFPRTELGKVIRLRLSSF